MIILKLEGMRSRGRPRHGMIDDLKAGSYVTMKKWAKDKDLRVRIVDLPVGRGLMMKRRVVDGEACRL